MMMEFNQNNKIAAVELEQQTLKLIQEHGLPTVHSWLFVTKYYDQPEPDKTVGLYFGSYSTLVRVTTPAAEAEGLEEGEVVMPEISQAEFEVVDYEFDGQEMTWFRRPKNDLEVFWQTIYAIGHDRKWAIPHILTQAIV